MAAATAAAIPKFIVSTVPEEPYLIPEVDAQGNNRFVGYMKDLMDALAAKGNFEYDFQITKDETYGKQGPDGWTGIVGDIVNGAAQIGAGALSVTRDRKEVVKFTDPFMTTAVNLLVKKPERLDMGLGYLVRPFSTDFWILLLASVILVGFLFFLIGHFSPFEWVKVADDKDPRGARNAFSLRNSYLFVLSSLTWQGFREPPRSISGRFLAAFWWIFVLFTLSAYTANLTAFLLARPEQMPIMPFKTYGDLVEAQDISVGAVRFGSTQDGLRKDKDLTHQALWNKMIQQNSFVGSYREGLARVKKSNGHFVMFMESTTAEYLARKNCGVMLYGDSIFNRQFALATNLTSNLGHILQQGLDELREEGQLDMLKQRWWRFSGECSGIDGRQFSQKGDSLSSLPIYPITLRDMAVAILLLFLGIIVAVVFLIVEIVYSYVSKGGEIKKPKVLEGKIFTPPKMHMPKVLKNRRTKPKPVPTDEEAAAASEPLTDEVLEAEAAAEVQAGPSGEPAAAPAPASAPAPVAAPPAEVEEIKEVKDA